MSTKFTEAKLEEAFIELLGNEGYPHFLGNTINRNDEEVLIEEDLIEFLLSQYKNDGLTINEAKSIVLQLKTLPSSDLYETNKTIMQWLADGFTFKREDRNQKDIWIYLIDYSEANNNTYKFVNQLEIVGTEKRIPDGIIYINGLFCKYFSVFSIDDFPAM
jgi:type I restriction enzyme R subunit